MTLGEKLRQLRVEAKRTQQEQADLLGVSLNTVYRWENGLAFPSHPRRQILSEHFGVPEDWLADDCAGYRIVSSEENEFLSLFGKASNAVRNRVIAYMEMCV